MGQYYYAVIEINEQKVVYDRKVDGEYTPAKLTEHRALLFGYKIYSRLILPISL